MRWCKRKRENKKTKKTNKPAGRGHGRVGGIVTARRLKTKVKVVSVSSRGRIVLAKRKWNEGSSSSEDE